MASLELEVVCDGGLEPRAVRLHAVRGVELHVDVGRRVAADVEAACSDAHRVGRHVRARVLLRRCRLQASIVESFLERGEEKEAEADHSTRRTLWRTELKLAMMDLNAIEKI